MLNGKKTRANSKELINTLLTTNGGFRSSTQVLTAAWKAKLIKEKQLEASTPCSIGEAGTLYMVEVESTDYCKYYSEHS